MSSSISKSSGYPSALADEVLRSLNLVVGLDQLLEVFSAKFREVSETPTVFIALFEPITNRYNGCKAKGINADRLAASSFSGTGRLKKIFHADKLATFGELTAGAAHEIRNPLTSFRCTAQYLIKDLPIDKKALGDGIVEKVDRIDANIKGLLSLSRSTELVIRKTDIHDNLQQTLSLLEPELHRRDIELRKTVAIADCHIAADPSQRKQLFLDILLNGSGDRLGRLA